MKIDKFTKVILTIIAVNLTILTTAKLDVFPVLQAGEPLQNQNLNYGLVPLNEDGSINVRLSNSEEIDVNITDISTSDELNVKLTDIGTNEEIKVNVANISTSSELNVNIEDVDQWAFESCTVPVEVQN